MNPRSGITKKKEEHIRIQFFLDFNLAWF